MHTVPSHAMRKSLLLGVCATAALLLVPLVAMQFTAEVTGRRWILPSPEACCSARAWPMY
jgi:hypothetical protein